MLLLSALRVFFVLFVFLHRDLPNSLVIPCLSVYFIPILVWWFLIFVIPCQPQLIITNLFLAYALSCFSLFLLNNCYFCQFCSYGLKDNFQLTSYRTWLNWLCKCRKICSWSGQRKHKFCWFGCLEEQIHCTIYLLSLRPVLTVYVCLHVCLLFFMLVSSAE